MSKYKKQIADYQKQSRKLYLALTVLTAIVALNAIAVTTGLADSYYAEVHHWLTARL
ncbi:MAG: hypothetical protein OEY66_06400 [Gammaproteobacteria bacterium]|nr:hypothetical protein [Gammaproteobacteria bacterium]